LEPWVYCTRQEIERSLIRWLRSCQTRRPETLRLLEVGCGLGGNLLQFLRLGFLPENLIGIELQPERAVAARSRLPGATSVMTGDALDLELPDSSVDVVFQSLVFSSILDEKFQGALASKIWRLAAPGGGVLWYDFTFDNPSNPDVRGVNLRRVRELFPDADIIAWRLTLAPPVSRRITRIHPVLYSWFNALPLLRTHMMCWLRKT
jgi:SAM-dependent methyltransferase